MNIVTATADLRALHKTWRDAHCRVALVPTMGNLHAGHLALVQQAKQLADRVVVSIFVNPTQFGPQEDFNTYPRTQEADLEKLRALAVDAVFLPSVAAIYPQGTHPTCYVETTGIANELCGKSRPGHFSGVATVVAKLFNLVQPNITVFGQKDFQQITIIRQLIENLNFPIELIMAPTVRENDGLAMSSRNQYLSLEERQIAPALYATLCWVRSQIAAGDVDYASLSQDAATKLSQSGFVVDYVTVRNKENLTIPTAPEKASVILAAATLGRTRLIDNVLVSASD